MGLRVAATCLAAALVAAACGDAALVPPSQSGTLVAAFLMPDQIALFSDGRVIDSDSGRVHNDWSKVHQLAPMVGMLTAGHYMPHLRDDIRRNSQARNVTAVDDVANVSSLVLVEAWRQ